MKKKIQGYNRPTVHDTHATHNRPCQCKSCGAQWTEQRPGPGYINGFDYYDYCSECEDKQETNCIDCGVKTKPGQGSARCPECWDSRLGVYK